MYLPIEKLMMSFYWQKLTYQPELLTRFRFGGYRWANLVIKSEG